MLKKFFSGGASIAVFDQTLGNEILEVLAVLRTLKSRSGRLRYVKENLHRMNRGIWGFSVDQLYSCDSERPYVRLEIISVLLDHFRGHPEGSANERVPLRFNVCELCCYPEVGQFDLASRG